jgi:hypothetical protein
MPAKRKSNCEARQHSDQMICGRCGLSWDIGDPEPPKCKREHHSTAHPVPPARAVAILAPERLPASLAERMARTYTANATHGAVVAMDAAYRVFLDEVAP